jgi:sugar fermentation stimulation protein A
MRILEGTVRGTLLGRPNRWTVTAVLENQELYCFAPNPGRLRELLVPGRRVYVRPRVGGAGATTHELVAVEAEGVPVPIDTRLPNLLVHDALLRRALPEFSGYWGVVREFPFGTSRLDFLLQGPRPTLVEVKCCTLVSNGLALFPDAPTARGVRHLKDLVGALRAGYRSAMMFVVQRPGARTLRPFDANDPAFGAALRAAAGAGVEVLAYGCRFRRGDLALAGALGIDLSGPPPSA